MASILVSNVDPAMVEDFKQTATRLDIAPGILVTRLLDLLHALQFAQSSSADAEVRELVATLLRDNGLLASWTL